MRRATVFALLVMLLLQLPTATLAQESDGPDSTAVEEGEGQSEANACDLLSGTARLACSTVTAVTGSGVDRVVSSSAERALGAVVDFVVDGAAWLLSQIVAVIDDSTTPRLTADWFQGSYQDMVTIAALGLLPFLLLAIIQAIVRQSVGNLIRALAMVPIAALGTAVAIVVVDMLVAITDNLSAWIGRGIEDDVTAFTSDLGEHLLVMSAQTGGMTAGLAALLAGLLVAFASFVIWLELLLRQAAIYVAVLFLPLAFMAMVWPATAHWLKRLAQGLVAIILSKFVIVAVIALAASALNIGGSPDPDGAFATVLAGGSMLGLAALAPYVLLRLIPVFDSSDTGQLEGTFRRPTAAVSSPAAGKGGQVSRLMRQRGGGGMSATTGTATRGAATAAGGVAAGVATAGLATAAVGAKSAGRATTQTAAKTTAQAGAAATNGSPDKPSQTANGNGRGVAASTGSGGADTTRNSARGGRGEERSSG